MFIFKLTLCHGLNTWEQSCRQKGLLCEFIESLLLLKMLQYFFALLCVWTAGGRDGSFASVQFDKNPAVLELKLLLNHIKVLKEWRGWGRHLRKEKLL